MSTSELATWKNTSIGSLCDLITGRAFKPKEWSNSGLPIIRIQNLNNAAAKYNHFDGEIADKHRIENGDFLFAWPAGRDSQIKEWISGNLALHFDIPVAPFKLVYVPEEILEVLPADQAGALGAGPAFGSVERRVTEITFPQIRAVPLEIRKALLCFDWWISNGDRCLSENGGNPNLFWEPNKPELVVIDHNQAFDPDVTAETFFRDHIFHDVSAEIADDLVERQIYTDRMNKALDHWDAIVAQLPDEWFYIDPEMTIEVGLTTQVLKMHLLRCLNDDFWNWK